MPSLEPSQKKFKTNDGTTIMEKQAIEKILESFSEDEKDDEKDKGSQSSQ